MGSDQELFHDRVNGTVGENPSIVFPEYKRTGKINRAYVAIEGLYGERVKSRGAEDDVSRSLSVDKKMRATKRLPAKIMFQNTKRLYELFKLEIDPTLLKNRQGILLVKKKLRNYIENHPEIDVNFLAKETLFKDPDFLKRLDIKVNFLVERCPKREAGYSKLINSHSKQNGDAAFIVGAVHCKNLAKTIKGYNLYVLYTLTVVDNYKPQHWEAYGAEEYKREVIEFYMWQLGLIPRPKQNVYF